MEGILLKRIQSQLEIMVDFMTNHSDLAKGLLNESLCLDLNAAGPAVPDIEKWKKVLYIITN